MKIFRFVLMVLFLNSHLPECLCPRCEGVSAVEVYGQCEFRGV
jgi:hypothetical protein